MAGAKVISVMRGEARIMVEFTESELTRWKSYAEKYAALPGADWFLVNQISGLLSEAKDR